MNILFVANEFPYPPSNGVRIPVFHAMRLLVQSGHKVFLAVCTDTVVNQCDIDKFQDVVKCSAVQISHTVPLGRFRIALRSLANCRMYFLTRYRSAKFSELIKQVSIDNEIDVVHLDLITMSQYHSVFSRRVGIVASINDSYALSLENRIHDRKSSILWRLYRRMQLVQARTYESRVYPKINRVHTVSKVDADYLSALNASIKTVVISNGVSPELLDLGNANIGKRDIIFVGGLSGVNLQYVQLFAHTMWPKIYARFPDVNFTIVGRIPDVTNDAVVALETEPGIRLHGFVHRLSDAYKLGGISVVPIDKTCGQINKAVEGLAVGHAVVGFESTFSGIPGAIDGENCVKCSDGSQFPDRIIELLGSPDRLESMQKSAQTLAAKNYSWDSRTSQYEALYRDAMEDALKQLQ